MTDRTITAPPDVPPDVRGDTPPATSDNAMPFDAGQAAPAGAAQVPGEEFRSPEEAASAEPPDADDDGSAQDDAEEGGRRLPAGQLALGGASGAATVLGTLYHLLGLPGVVGGAVVTATGAGLYVARRRQDRNGSRSRSESGPSRGGGSGPARSALFSGGRSSRDGVASLLGGGRTRRSGDGGLLGGRRRAAGGGAGHGPAGSSTSTRRGGGGGGASGSRAQAPKADKTGQAVKPQHTPARTAFRQVGRAGRTIGRAGRAAGRGVGWAGKATGRGIVRSSKGVARGAKWVNRTAGDRPVRVARFAGRHSARATRAIGRAGQRLGHVLGRGARRAGAYVDRRTGRRVSAAWKAVKGSGGGFRQLRRRAAAGLWRWDAGLTASAVALVALISERWRKRRKARAQANAGADAGADAGAGSTTTETTTGTTTETDQASTTQAGAGRRRRHPYQPPFGGATTRRSLHMSGSFPLVAAAAEMNALAHAYAPVDMWQVSRELDQLPELPANVANSVRAYLVRLQGEYPIHPAVVEKLGQFYAAHRVLITIAQEVGPLFKQIHADDLKREDAPRTNEPLWNV
ncbi:hypothetical protein ACGFI3_46205 [Nonomuraea wenchangensis]|uniref:hypothetical protein n=1 Tax=Nonomuraea wenchangensis TaxID=568860 RepID=UPI00371454C1